MAFYEHLFGYGPRYIFALLAYLPIATLLRRLGFSAGWAVPILLAVVFNPLFSGAVHWFVGPNSLVSTVSPSISVIAMMSASWMLPLALLWFFALRSSPKAVAHD